MRALARRLDALETDGRLAPIGEVLDYLRGEPIPNDKSIDPALIAALDALPER